MAADPKPVVEFVDSRGLHWRVYERRIQASRTSQPVPCLIFDSGDILRRVRDFPLDWDVLEPHDLEALSWRL